MRTLVLTVLEKLYLLRSTFRSAFLRRVLGMDIDASVHIASRARLDKTHPAGIHIGAYTHIGSGVTVLAHDFVRAIYADTRIGSHYFIGIHTIVMPGVTIGDHVIVGAGSVVTKDVPSHCIVAGNPARIIRHFSEPLSRYGQFSRAMLEQRTTHEQEQKASL